MSDDDNDDEREAVGATKTEEAARDVGLIYCGSPSRKKTHIKQSHHSMLQKQLGGVRIIDVVDSAPLQICHTHAGNRTMRPNTNNVP